MYSLEGKCLKCGECCRTNLHIEPFETEMDKKNAVEWLVARGYKVVGIGKSIIIAEYKNECPSLVLSLCGLQNLDNKPKMCQKYPYYNAEVLEKEGIDPNFVLTSNCGFSYKAV